MLLLLLVLVGSREVEGQLLVRAGGRNEVFAGSELERYLRYLQSFGQVPLYPWSNRGFSPAEVDRLVSRASDHPWSAQVDFTAPAYWKPRISVVAPTGVVRFNSGFPFGSNDGPVWAGRGLTTSVQAGVSGRWGPLSISLAPLLFRAENTAFTLQPNKEFEIVPGGPRYRQPFADGVRSRDVDRPQRFGDKPYSMLDPGQSYVRLDWKAISGGFSTANEWWGPANDYPVILGNNAGGFPHFFAGTGHPLNLFLGTIHFKAMWGRLAQSAYSTVTGSDYWIDQTESGRYRFMAGALGVVQIRGVPGLEIGAARFYHSILRESGPTRDQLLLPFSGFVRKSLDPDDEFFDQFGDNQLVSVFFRWVLPRSGADVYAEYGRDDHNYDFRDLVNEPDHARVYTFGVRKVMRSDSVSFTAVRGELINFQLPTLIRHRDEGSNYTHSLIRQGHTFRGQLLGADVGVGSAAGSTIAVDRYDERGRLTVAWLRDLRQERGEYWSTGVQRKRSIDMWHALQVDAIRFFAGHDLNASVALVRNFNRNFEFDATNLNVTIGARLKRW